MPACVPLLHGQSSNVITLCVPLQLLTFHGEIFGSIFPLTNQLNFLPIYTCDHITSNAAISLNEWQSRCPGSSAVEFCLLLPIQKKKLESDWASPLSGTFAAAVMQRFQMWAARAVQAYKLCAASATSAKESPHGLAGATMASPLLAPESSSFALLSFQRGEAFRERA